MTIAGRVLRLPPALWNDVNTDVILAGAHLRVPEEELGRHAFEGVLPDFPELVSGRPILAAGKNFGCGSSREQAPKAILGCGVRLIVAESFGGIFFRNALNLGLALLKVVDPATLDLLQTDVPITVDVERGEIEIDGGASSLLAKPLSKHLLKIVHAGGLLPLLRADAGALE